MLTALGRARRRALLPLLLLLALLAPSGPAAAQEDGEPIVSEDGVRSLIATLEDPAQREELVQNLRALLAVQEPEPPPPDPATALAWLAEEVARPADAVQEVARSVVASLNRVPQLFRWLREQIADPDRRALWRAAGGQAALVLGLGIAAHLFATLALTGRRRRLGASRPVGLARHTVGLLRWFAVHLLPVIAFGVVAYAVLAALDPARPTEVAIALLINAGVIGGTATAVLRALFAPDAPGLRPLALPEEGAVYGFGWLRRVLTTAIYGTFILEAALRLGLPWTVHVVLLDLLYLAVAAMVVTMIVRRHEQVAAGIARLDDGEERTGLRLLPWQTVAQVWHLLALIYVAAAYLIWMLRIPGGFRFLIGATLGSLLVLLAAWAVLHAIERLTRREVRIPDETEDAVPGTEERVNRYLPVIAVAGRVLVGVVVALALLQVWGVDIVGWFGTETGRAFGGALLAILVVAAVTFALWEVGSLLLGRAMAATDAAGNLVYTGRTRTLLTITRSVLLAFLGTMAVLLTLAELGVNIAPLLAGAGVIGLAIGFGSQKLVQDIITGTFVLLADTIRVGDVVDVAGKGGLVEAVTMRTVRLRSYDGVVHTIPYSAIDTVTNLTKDFSFYVFDVGVAYREDVNQVMQALRDIGAGMQRDPYFRRLILEPLDVAGVDRFADSAVVIRARIKTPPLKQWEVGREFNRRMKMRFDELGIEIPFPHRTLYFGVDRQGEAPPAWVRVRSASAPESDDAPVPAEAQTGAAAAGPERPAARRRPQRRRSVRSRSPENSAEQKGPP